MTDDPDAVPPPIFKSKDLDHVVINQFAMGFLPVDLTLDSESTAMLIVWRMLKTKTVAKVAKLTGLPKEHVVKLQQCFDDNAPPDLKDWASTLGEF